ncbi:MAG: NAD(P)H-dependent oxidoreductase subunit E [Deltaproteobacteria bacterium]|nr:NAD(P)H-dependent oxidoreductase subunit E [Deltaproteobacteria bacterium]
MAVDVHPQHEDISAQMWEKIDQIISENKARPGSIITVLRKCQDTVAYLPVELINYISHGMNLPSSEVFGIATFYALFSFEPKGRHNIKLCLGTACYVKGMREIMDRVRNTYEIKEGETTLDRRFSLEAVRCIGACGLAPVVMVDEDIHGIVSADKIIDVLEDYE